MAAKKSLPYVQTRRRRDGSLVHRGYADKPGGTSRDRQWGDWLDDEQAAYNDALRMRGEQLNTAAGETLDDAIEALKDEQRLKRTPDTVRWTADHCRAICRLIPGETPLHEITRATVEQYIRERLQKVDGKRIVKPQTVNADLRALHRVFAFAILRSIVKENPVHGVERPRSDVPAIDWFTEDELGAAIAKLPIERWRDAVLLFASTGVRRKEASKIEPVHIRTNSRQIVIPGKRRTRVVPLAPALDEPLRRLLAAAHGGRLFPGGVHEIDDLFRFAKKACGDRRLHAHAMRHTFCTTLIRQGVRLDVVMRLADHRDIKTTMRYAHEVGAEGIDAVSRLRYVPPAAPVRAAEK